MKRFIAIILLAVSLTGCKDFFDISNPQTLSQENFPATLEQVDLLLTSSYAGSHSIGLYAFYWFPMGVYLYDHTSDLYGSYDERAFSQDNYSSIDSRYLTTTYTDLCKWAKLATAAIEAIDKYAQTAPQSEQTQLSYMRGQALFNRAVAYWHAQIFYELNADALGFPIIDRVINDVEELKLSRATVRDTWLFMLNDFEEAATLLTGYHDAHRANEWAAKSMLAKAYMQSLYLFPENRAKTQALLEDIIQNSGKRLVDYDVYADMFFGNQANEHNSESLYELTFTTDPNQNGPWEGYTTGNGQAMVYAPWYVNLDIRFRAGREDKTDPLTLENDIMVCSKSSEWGNNFIHDRNIARFGFSHFHGDTVPRWTFNPDFKSNAERSRDNFPYRLADTTYQADAIALKNDPTRVDPRLKLFTGQPYVDEFIDSKGRSTWYDKSTELNNRHNILAWQHRKYTNTRGTEIQLNESSNANIYIARLADIYLLYAELMAEQNPSVALEYVNKVHRRAYGFSPDTPCAFDYTSLNDRTKTSDPTDHLANDVIKYERWAELFAEGQWWFDIRRYRIGQQEADYYVETRHGPITWKGDCSYVQPIPQLELERNKNIRQSDGYPSI